MAVVEVLKNKTKPGPNPVKIFSYANFSGILIGYSKFSTNQSAQNQRSVNLRCKFSF